MGLWDTVFAKAPPIKWLKEQVDILLAASGFDEIDISSKIDKPSSFPSGNFATYNTTTEELENTGKNADSFVEDADYNHTDNNFTDEHKDIVETLEGFTGDDDKMDKVTVTGSTLNKLTRVGSDGNVEATGVDASGVFIPYGLSFPITPPYTGSINTVTVGLYRAVYAFYTLGLSSSRARHRTGVMLLLLNDTDEPIIMPMGEGNKGDDFDGDISVSISDGTLVFSYTRAVGDDNADYLSIKILPLS